MAKPVTPRERARIVAAIKAGGTRNDVAREYGRSQGTITGIAEKAGLTFDRSAIKEATEARTTDIRARLAALAEGLVSDAEKLRTQVFAPHMAYSFGGRDNDYNEHEIPEPSPRDKQALLTAAAICVDKARQIVAAEAPGGEEARGLVRELLDGVQDWAASQPPPADE